MADFVSKDYRQTIIYDNKTGSAVVLKEIGTAKYLTDSVMSNGRQKMKNLRACPFCFQMKNKR